MSLRKTFFLILLFAILFTGCLRTGSSRSPDVEPGPEVEPNQDMQTLTLTSIAFENNANIPKKYTCDGENYSPPLRIDGIPSAAQSLVLIVDDPDAPGKVWTHWLVWNIPPQFNDLPEGSPPPSALQGVNDFASENYGGPCPPPGAPHRYFFKLYALDTILEIQRGANKSILEKAMEGHILSQTQLVGIYGRGQ